MKRASYARAVEWIALNDEDSETDIDTVESQITVLLVADLWGRDPRAVALQVLKERRENG